MRIATNIIASMATLSFQRAQADLFEAGQQVGSEHKASDLRGFQTNVTALISARGLLSRSQGYVATSIEITNRLDVQDLALGHVSTAASDLKTALTESIGLDKGDDVMQRISASFFDTLGAMTTSYAGKYVFGGVRDDTLPVNVTTLDQLEAAGAASAIFENAPRRATVQLDSRTSLEIAPLANDVSEPFFELMRRFKDYETANGAFVGALTAAQKTFIEGELVALETITKDLVEQQALNGGISQRAASLIERQEDEGEYLERLVGDIQNADLAEVSSRLSLAQTQMEASARVYSIMTEASLLNYLR